MWGAVLPAVAALMLALASPAAADPGLVAEIEAISGPVAGAWATMQMPDGTFANPVAAEVAAGHGGFAPPMLVYAIAREGERAGDAALAAAAQRAWPSVVDPARASSFDMIGAAYAYRRLALPDGLRALLAGYMGRYSIPPCGHACIADPGCYNNLKLVDALAVLAITGGGVRSDTPGARLSDPAAARAEATRIVNERIPQVVDYGLRAQVGGRSLTATVLSDPGGNQIAYHALSTLMLAEAVDQLGAAASPGARRALRGTLDALSVLAGPDGEADYFGRGQGNVWVPAATAAAMIEGAALVQATDPGRAARYLAVAHAALARLRRLHLTPDRGLLVVPGVRTSYDGIDFYVHTVAYNGLAMWALALAADRAAALAPATGEPPAWGRLDAVDPAASGLAVVSTGRTWLAVRSVTNGDNHDLRNSFGLLALKVREPSGWRDLLGPAAAHDRLRRLAGTGAVERWAPRAPARRPGRRLRRRDLRPRDLPDRRPQRARRGLVPLPRAARRRRSRRLAGAARRPLPAAGVRPGRHREP